MLVFDKPSGRRVELDFPCSHDLWVDKEDRYVLVCRSFRTTSGGVAVNELALGYLHRLDIPPEKKQLYLKSMAGWEWMGTLDQLPDKDPIEGTSSKYPGEIRIYDRDDLYPDEVPFPVERKRPSKPSLPEVAPPTTLLAASELSLAQGEEITLRELQRRTGSKITNPTLETLRMMSLEHPFSVTVDHGKVRFTWGVK